MTTNQKELLTAAQVRKLEGDISDMGLWRRINDPQLGFPKPIYILKRRYWDSTEYWEYREARVAARDAGHSKMEAA